MSNESARLSRGERNALRMQRRAAARERVKARGAPPGCPRPDKPAYDQLDHDERDLQRRMLGPGLQSYDCRCGFSHNGHPAE